MTYRYNTIVLPTLTSLKSVVPATPAATKAAEVGSDCIIFLHVAIAAASVHWYDLRWSFGTRQRYRYLRDEGKWSAVEAERAVGVASRFEQPRRRYMNSLWRRRNG